MALRRSIFLNGYLAIVLLLPVPIQAADKGLEVRAGVSYTDNVARTPSQQIEEFVGVLGVTTDLENSSKRFEASLVSDLEFRHYAEDTFDDEVVGALDANVLIHLLPDKVNWIFRDRFGNILTDPFRADVGENRERINRISTGPDFELRIKSNTSVQIGGRFHLTEFEQSNSDNVAKSVRVGINRALSRNRSLIFDVSADDTDFEDNLENNNYQKQTAFFGIDSAMSRGSIVAHFGLNKLKDDSMEIDNDLYHFLLTRDLSPRVTLKLRYDQKFTDNSDSLGTTLTDDPAFSESQQTPGNSDPFENKRFAAQLDFDREPSVISLSFTQNRDEYLVSSTLDRERSEARVSLSRRFAYVWALRLSGAIRKTDFLGVDRSDDDIVARLGLSRYLTSSIAINVDYAYFDRNSNDPNAVYTDQVATFTVSYVR